MVIMKTYKALKPVGRWKKGEIVGGLSDAQIKQLVAERIIEEVQDVQAPKTTKSKEVKTDVET